MGAWLLLGGLGFAFAKTGERVLASQLHFATGCFLCLLPVSCREQFGQQPFGLLQIGNLRRQLLPRGMQAAAQFGAEVLRLVAQAVAH